MAEVQHSAQARRLVSNTMLLAGSQVIVRAASLVAFPLLANSVEPDTLGVYVYAGSIAATWAVLANFHLRLPLIRETAHHRERTGELVGQVLALRLLLALVVVAASSVWCLADFTTTRERAIFAILLLASVIQAVTSTYEDALQAWEAFPQSAAALVVHGLTLTGGTILGVVVGRPIAYAAASTLLASLAYGLLVWYLAVRRTRQRLLRLHWSNSSAWHLLRLAGVMAIAGQIGAWYGRLDVLAIRRLLNNTQLGLYMVPYRALVAGLAAVMALHTVIVPVLARAQAAGTGALAPRLTTVLRFTLLVLVPLTALVSGLSPVILSVFKPEYAPGAPVLAVLAWVAPLSILSATLHVCLYLADRPVRVVGAMSLGLAANATLCWMLVPRYQLLGAAWSRVAAEGLIILATVPLGRRWLPVDWRGVIIKPGLMSAALVAAWLAAGQLHLALRATVGLAVYALAGAVLRPLEQREWDLVRSLFRRARRQPSGLEPSAEGLVSALGAHPALPLEEDPGEDNEQPPAAER